MYVKQPPDLEDFDFQIHLYKLKKSLYDIKKAPRSWYDRLTNFLLENDFIKGQVGHYFIYKII